MLPPPLAYILYTCENVDNYGWPLTMFTLAENNRSLFTFSLIRDERFMSFLCGLLKNMDSKVILHCEAYTNYMQGKTKVV